jgi:Ca2+-binding RTX toxin-like protein
MKRAIVLTVSLVAALLVAAPTAGAQELPEDCAVPPEIDLALYHAVIGSNRSEVLKGTEGPDFFCGLLGNDVILAFGGDDLILGDTTTFFGNVQAPGGNDVILAGAGDDQVLPGPGNDVVEGGSGDDFLALAVGNDVGHGGPGADGINGGFGRDLILGGPGDDLLSGGFDNDLINGGSGDDFLAGELPPDSPPPPVPAEPAENDRCIGASGVDTALECDVTIGIEEVQG